MRHSPSSIFGAKLGFSFRCFFSGVISSNIATNAICRLSGQSQNWRWLHVGLSPRRFYAMAVVVYGKISYIPRLFIVMDSFNILICENFISCARLLQDYKVILNFFHYRPRISSQAVSIHSSPFMWACHVPAFKLEELVCFINSSVKTAYNM